MQHIMHSKLHAVAKFISFVVHGGTRWAFFNVAECDVGIINSQELIHPIYFFWYFPDLDMDSFSTKSLAVQAQKKLMSKMATKSMASLFIDDTSSEVLDELYRVTKEYTRNRKEAQKIIKNLVKMVVKLGVLYRNNQFNGEELILVDNFRSDSILACGRWTYDTLIQHVV